tara:strand:+ start:2805 stop:3203 length:399 start_codon:yes stop_codon:yes gene_type:complete
MTDSYVLRDSNSKAVAKSTPEVYIREDGTAQRADGFGDSRPQATFSPEELGVNRSASPYHRNYEAEKNQQPVIIYKNAEPVVQEQIIVSTGPKTPFEKLNDFISSPWWGLFVFCSALVGLGFFLGRRYTKKE